MRICFVDTETTGLDRKRRQIWDFACIVRDIDEKDGVTYYTDQDVQFFIDVELSDADPFALKIGHFWERFPGRHVNTDPKTEITARGTGNLLTQQAASLRISELTANAIWVGAVPSFDEETCAKMLRYHGLMPRWDYHLVDVETLAAGMAGIHPPWKNDVINKEFGIVIPPEDRHTALGDARGVRDLYDAVLKP